LYTVARWEYPKGNPERMRVQPTAALCLPLCFAIITLGCGGSSAIPPIPPPPPPAAQELLFADSATGIQTFSIKNGGLTALATTQDSGLGLFITGNMLTAASGKFLLVTDSTGSQIKVFSINQTTGGLMPVAGSPFSIGGPGSGSLAMDPSGKYLYAPYQAGVAAFSFNGSTGTLTPLVGSPFSDGSSPFAGTVDRSGKFFYTTGSTAQTGLSVYALNSASGALTPVAGSPFLTPSGNPPYNLLVSPGAETIYAALPSNNAVLGFNINLMSGAPTAVTGSPFSTADLNLDTFLGMDPAGKFLYTCNEGNGTISAFAANSASGALTSIAGSPFGFINCSTTVAVDPSGSYLYAANPGGNAITGFSIDAATGSLTMLSGSPFPATDATLITIVTYQ
jgi:6-phosphogluconolactonase (cycloisomerase 2 family)